jgi:hypothetical protein
VSPSLDLALLRLVISSAYGLRLVASRSTSAWVLSSVGAAVGSSAAALCASTCFCMTSVMCEVIAACRFFSSMSSRSAGFSGSSTSVWSAGTATGGPTGWVTCTTRLPRAGALPTTLPGAPVGEWTVCPLAIRCPCRS